MAKKKKYKKSYTTGGRVDMRNGGRVGYAVGDRAVSYTHLRAHET